MRDAVQGEAKKGGRGCLYTLLYFHNKRLGCSSSCLAFDLALVAGVGVGVKDELCITSLKLAMQIVEREKSQQSPNARQDNQRHHQEKSKTDFHGMSAIEYMSYIHSYKAHSVLMYFVVGRRNEMK